MMSRGTPDRKGSILMGVISTIVGVTECEPDSIVNWDQYTKRSDSNE